MATGALKSGEEIDITVGTLTPLANLTERDYHNIDQMNSEKFGSIEAWIRRIEDGRRNRLREALDRIGGLRGRVLEIGAGSCWVTGEVSRLPDVTRAVAVELSERILRDVAPSILAHVGARTDKINLIAGDFHRVAYDDGHFDAVVADAALHHAGDLDVVLREMARLLRPGGLILGIREPTLPALPILRGAAIRREKHAESHGAKEILLSQRDWYAAFTRAGLRPSHFPTPNVSPTVWRGRLARSRLAELAVYPMVMHSAFAYVARKPPT